MKKILRFGAAVVALCFGLMCFVACQDSTKGGTPSGGNPSGDGGSSSAKLPASVGDNPLVSDSSTTDIVLTVYDENDKADANYKVEFYADGTATEYYLNEKYDEETYQVISKEYKKMGELKYSWDAEKKNIYLVYTGIYEDFGDGNKLYTSATAYNDAWVESERKKANEEYKKYKSEVEASCETPLSLDEWAEENYGKTFEEYMQEIKDEIEADDDADVFDFMYTLSYKSENGKLIFTGVYTGFANSDFGYLNGDDDSLENWDIWKNGLSYSKRDESNNIWVDYSRDSYDKTTITYKVDKWSKETSDKLGLPEKIVANYMDDVPNGKLTITFTDPLTKKEISSSFTFEPRYFYEL